MVIKRARDGSRLWECSICHEYKNGKEFVKHSKRRKEDNICRMCADLPGPSEQINGALAWLFCETPPGETVFQTVLWRELRPVVCRFRRKANIERYPAAMLRKHAFQGIFTQASPIPETYREPILKVMAGYDIKPRGSVWLAFREGVFNKEQFRRLAIGFTEQVVESTQLDKQFEATHAIMEEVRRCVGVPYAKLTTVLQNARAIQCEVEKTCSRSSPIPHAADALAGMCLPRAKDAAVATIYAALEVFKRKGVFRKVALANLNDVIRQIAEQALQAYTKEELVHWDGLVSVTLAGAITVEGLEK